MKRPGRRLYAATLRAAAALNRKAHRARKMSKPVVLSDATAARYARLFADCARHMEHETQGGVR